MVNAATTMLGMPAADELPVDVLTELGRVTWAAIKLEDYAKGICSAIDPRNPRIDRRQLSARIGDAKKVLEEWPERALAAEATGWLERARLAMERRNAMLHATPMVRIDLDRRKRQLLAVLAHAQRLRLRQRGRERRLFLGEMPRTDRPYTERPLTVESLAELRSVIDGAADGWR